MAEELSDERLGELIAGGETELVEFKRDWYDLSNNEGKARFVKGVLALANSAGPDRPAYLLIGVQDAKHGGGLTGTPSAPPPPPEAVAQILASWTLPPVKYQLTPMTVRGLPVNVITVQWSPASPHHAAREVGGVLDRDAIYRRRGPTIGRASIGEVEVLFREKTARLGPNMPRESLEVGFVDVGQSSRREVVARVKNLTEEDVGGVRSMFDVALRAFPGAAYRQSALSGVTLAAGESREFSLEFRHVTVWIDGKAVSMAFASDVRLGWIDVTLSVHFRERTGVIGLIERRMPIAW